MGRQVQYAILRTLSYFDVFQYPLREDEIWKFMPVKCETEDITTALDYLLNNRIVFRLENFYSLHNDQSLALRRNEGNNTGNRKLKRALFLSKFLGQFPFVEAVCISGSLSKDFAFEDSDLDYFIVTTPNRLWIARNLMHLFRKLTFVVNAQGSFCMNYYLSLHQPEILPNNLYTAIELSTLKTGFHRRGMNEIATANNDWVRQLLPNIDLEKQINTKRNKKWLFTTVIEFLINKLNGDAIEKYFYKTTMKRWEKKWHKYGHDIDQCMRSAGLHINTPINYPVHLPDRIMDRFETIYQDAEQRLHVLTEHIIDISGQKSETLREAV